MEKNWWENVLIKTISLIFFSSATTAALSKEKGGVIVRNFLAGVFGGFVAMIICSSTKWEETTKLIVCFVISAFVTSLWPLLGEIAKKYIKKKGDDTIQNS